MRWLWLLGSAWMLALGAGFLHETVVLLVELWQHFEVLGGMVLLLQLMAGVVCGTGAGACYAQFRRSRS